ncbi:MAG: hypothetical protein SOZ80_03865 [Prevotella sp.]|uniref:hypothetical protein n=1 Tax=Prevotella sp. TaxID=59823 RepID=UPI002A291E8C|nr:hypothetical protein [Prevotella sp.]MDD7317294.1 hypothetical protein [Prevotellaceae bacterium]MDY4019898.1 hypothetical protein [Prevotella sp.]
MNNQPARTFVLIAIIATALVYMHFMPQVSVAGTVLRDVDILSDIMPEIDGEDNDEVIAKPIVPAAPQGVAKTGNTGEEAPAKKKPCPPGATCVIDYSGGGAHGIDAFYKALANAQKMNRPVRVAYWGDSFIEGDILTTDLRALLQDKYGGNGVGWVDCGKTTNSTRPTVRVATSGFTSHSVMERKTFSSRLQGISQRYFTVNGSASATFSGTTWNKHCNSWGTSTIYFKTSTPISITATMNDGEEKSFRVEASPRVQSVSVTGEMTKVKWTVSGANSSTQFYGVALDPKSGVVLDNFAMRGSAGMSLAGIPEQTMREMAAKRPYDLLILQFGLNATSQRSTQKQLQHYTAQMTKVVDMLKRCYPEATILIVSTSDRDQRDGGQLKTMKGVEELVSYQQLMAADNKVAFFSLFDAMGGNGGISKMAQQGMAGKDYTHINFKGGAYLAKKMFDGIMFGK